MLLYVRSSVLVNQMMRYCTVEAWSVLNISIEFRHSHLTANTDTRNTL